MPKFGVPMWKGEGIAADWYGPNNTYWQEAKQATSSDVRAVEIEAKNEKDAANISEARNSGFRAVIDGIVKLAE